MSGLPALILIESFVRSMLYAVGRAASAILCVALSLAVLVSCSKPQDQGRKVKMYQSPMHPWITSDKPGNCTICGMAWFQCTRESPGLRSSKGFVALNPRSIDVLAVTTVPVRRLELTKSLRFSGILEDDENIHRVIAAFYDGRIDEIYVEHVGQYVEKGQPLAAIYSPELLYVVREYQSSMRSGDPAVARNSAQRLVQYGLSAEQVAGLAKQRENVFTIDLLAPISGTVLTKKALKGQYIKTGEPLFEMGNLSRLWFHAEVYERDLPDIRIGRKAILRTPTVPGREFEGVVTFVDPNFDPRTRSTRVRIEVDNPPVEGEGHGLTRVLPHRAYAEAEITAHLGESLVVPRSAVLRDGRRSLVYVEQSSGLRRIAVRSQDGLPIYLEDIAEISIGGDFRRGALDIDGREVVGGVVVMRTGENAMQVIQRVKEKIAQIAPRLPKGVTIVPFYDRSGLIERTIETLRHALIKEILLVTLAHVIFLWHFRSILIVTLPLPVSILISFILMQAFGITSNIMSLRHRHRRARRRGHCHDRKRDPALRRG